ncbi:MAG TPA: UrcA family protein, partial [Rhizomicrobium sp.]|nr:UrcA family protein [Rhizomicrobium sp.]
AGSALAAGDSEQVTVDAPYTIRQQPMTRTMLGQMPERRVTVESSVSYADLDFSKQADVDTMRDRLRKAVRDNCRELDRRFPSLVYIPVGQDNCVKAGTLQSFAQLDDIRASAGRSTISQSAKN